ncbi:MAG: lipoate--protein ligase [Prevotellaceae bacterium]|jgi:lipoate-protein ligase A|nr:lipoate--protein ligase [Prevotellaceae bacterium]
MQLIANQNITPYFNLAAEEYLLKNTAEEYFMLWQNEPTVVVGCHQHTAAEVNLMEAEKRGVHVVRRITGGGAVYHDLGNVNFSLVKNITDNAKGVSIYEELAHPVLKTLSDLGVKAHLGGRNDIMVGERKISGCAVHAHRGRILLHGALLFCTDLNVLSTILTPHTSKFEGKAVQSVAKRVVNVQDLLVNKISVAAFMQRLEQNIESNRRCKKRTFTQKEQEQIAKLEQEKFSQHDWIFGKIAPQAYSKIGRTSAGNVEVRLAFDSGKIGRVQLLGDFFAQQPIAGLEQRLQGCVHTPSDVKKRLREINLQHYIAGIQEQELLELFF